MAKLTVNRQVLYKNADNLAVWVSLDKNSDAGPQSARLSLVNAEIQSICNDHISTLDDTLHKKSKAMSCRRFSG
jgi:hypothetical protein